GSCMRRDRQLAARPARNLSTFDGRCALPGRPLPGWSDESDSKNRGFRAIYRIIFNDNLTIVSFPRSPCRSTAGFRSTEHKPCGRAFRVVAKVDETTRLSWPWWAPWTLLAVAVTSMLTIGATLYDIL